MAEVKELTPTTILFQKAGTGSTVKDLVDDFDMALISFPVVLSGGIKDYYANDWKDENGEEVFFPEKAYLKAYDLSVTLGIKGNVSNYLERWNTFFDYITGKDGTGTEFGFYSPWLDLGHPHCYFKDYKAKDGNRETGGGIFHTFDATIRITDPDSFLTAVLDDNGNYNLQIKG